MEVILITSKRTFKAAFEQIEYLVRSNVKKFVFSMTNIFNVKTKKVNLQKFISITSNRNFKTAFEQIEPLLRKDGQKLCVFKNKIGVKTKKVNSWKFISTTSKRNFKTAFEQIQSLLRKDVRNLSFSKTIFFKTRYPTHCLRKLENHL